MHRIWPPAAFGELDDAEVEQLYTYPADRSWLVVNFVSSADGGITVEGSSASLSVPADRTVFKLGSDLADVVLLGAGTAVNEGFTGIDPDEQAAARRQRHGLAPVPPIAVVTSGGDSLPADAPVLTDTRTPTLVIASGRLSQQRADAYRESGAEVVTVGESTVDLAAGVQQLHARGLHHIDCEGGPGIFQSLLQAGLVDELRLTVSPFLIGGEAARITAGEAIDPRRLRLDSAVGHDDAVLLRYLVERGTKS